MVHLQAIVPRMEILFFQEQTDFELPQDTQEHLRKWILRCLQDFDGLYVGEINYIFCSDDALLAMNQTYLQHDTLTDIITFDLSEEEDELSGDIHISIDRVKENSELYATTFVRELARVLIHGVLHLAGYTDSTEEEKAEMRAMEDTCLDYLAENTISFAY